MSVEAPDDSSIPLADADPQAVLPEEPASPERRARSCESLEVSSFDPDLSPDEQEEKARLISQVLELQNTLDDLSQRVDSVKEENLKLRSENQVLGQYIENLMQASSVFQSTSSPKVKKK